MSDDIDNDDIPMLDDSGGFEAVPPPEPAPRRRGRPPKERPSAEIHNLGDYVADRAPKGKAKRNLDGATMALQILHIAIADRLNQPGFCLKDDEAALLAGAGADLLEHYKIQLKGKNGAIIGMISALGVVYGPRLFDVFGSRIMGAVQGAAE